MRHRFWGQITKQINEGVSQIYKFYICYKVNTPNKTSNTVQILVINWETAQKSVYLN